MLNSTICGLCLSLLSAAFICGLATGEPQEKGQDKSDPQKSKFDPDSKDNLEGRARWEWKLENAKGKIVDNGTFMAYRTGQLYHAKKHIGTHMVIGDKQVRVVFTSGPLAGTADLRLISKRPATLVGDLSQKDGRHKLIVNIFND